MQELQVGLISVSLSPFFLLFFVPTFHSNNNYISLVYCVRLLSVATLNLFIVVSVQLLLQYFFAFVP